MSKKGVKIANAYNNNYKNGCNKSYKMLSYKMIQQGVRPAFEKIATLMTNVPQQSNDRTSSSQSVNHVFILVLQDNHLAYIRRYH